MKKLAIVTSHPIQYNAPLFRLLNQRNNVKVKVFYTWSQSKQGPKYDPGFGKKIEWDIPLLDGYEYTFVENISKTPGSEQFNGIENPTLIDEINAWQPDCILVFGWAFKSHLKCLRYFYKKKTIIFRGDSHLLAERIGIKKILRRIVLNWVYRHIDYALYVGTNNKMYYLRHGVKEKQLFIAPHAIDNDRFFDKNGAYSNEASLWRKQLGIKDSELIFLYAGKLEAKKNTEILINAYEELKIKNGVHLIIVGNGPLEAELKNKYAKIPNLHFLDFQNQLKMPVVYHLCDVFVLPSKGPIETWGLSINEAMACGKAVLVSNICGAAIDLVKEGVNGYSFDSSNKVELIEKMNLLSADKKKLKMMGDYSLRLIKDFSFDRICIQIENLVLKN